MATGFLCLSGWQRGHAQRRATRPAVAVVQMNDAGMSALARALPVLRSRRMAQQLSPTVPGVPAAQLGAMLLGLYSSLAEPEWIGTGGLLDWLSRHIVFDGAWFGRSLLEAGTLRPQDGNTRGLAPDFVTDWCRVRHIDPVVPAAMAQPGQGVAVAAHELPFVASVRAFAADHGIAKALSVIVPAPDSPCWMHLSLYSRDAAGLGTRERSLVELLMPHLVQVLDLRPCASLHAGPPVLAMLSRREAEVARLFAEGQSYKMVARALGSSPATVRHHLRQVYAKLGVTSKVQMARLVSGPVAQA